MVKKVIEGDDENQEIEEYVEDEEIGNRKTNIYVNIKMFIYLNASLHTKYFRGLHIFEVVLLFFNLLRWL